MALTADDVTAGEATEVFITLRRYLPHRERLGRGGVSRNVAAAPCSRHRLGLTLTMRAPRRGRGHGRLPAGDNAYLLRLSFLPNDWS
jgi:hypothetical protein